VNQPQDVSDDRTIRLKIRLDFKGTAKPARFFFGGKAVEKIADEVREQNVAVFRNVPFQGIKIMDIDMGMDVYTVYDDVNNIETAYAPVILDVAADSMEDILKLIAREDFRKVEVISPGLVTMNKTDVERILFRVAEEIKGYRSYMERKYNLR
jgi:hypothetical protein